MQDFIQVAILVAESGCLDARSRCRLAQTFQAFYKHQTNSETYQQLTLEPRLLTLVKQLPDDPIWQFKYIRQIGSFGRRSVEEVEEMGFAIGRRRCISYALIHQLPWTCVDRLAILIKLVIRACNLIEGVGPGELHIAWDDTAVGGITEIKRSSVVSVLFSDSAHIVIGILNSGKEHAYSIPSLLLDSEKWIMFLEFWRDLPSLEIT